MPKIAKEFLQELLLSLTPGGEFMPSGLTRPMQLGSLAGG
jgi:hypothetical protein